MRRTCSRGKKGEKGRKEKGKKGEKGERLGQSGKVSFFFSFKLPSELQVNQGREDKGNPRNK